MFIAKFQQVNNVNGKFTADRRQNLPFIGTVMAGTSKGTLINGTSFAMQGLIPNKLYACQNGEFVAEDGTVYPTVEVVSEVSLLEYSELRTKLGAPKLIGTNSEVAEPAEAIDAEA